MKLNNKLCLLLSICMSLFAACSSSRKAATASGTVYKPPVGKITTSRKKTFSEPINIDRAKFVSYAKTLLGTPYKYASAVPANGLDCSGFIYYVFNHFNVKAPRSSVDFTNEGVAIDAMDARPGDIILFTGSDNSTGIVGHMGIVTENNGGLKFIHSASGKAAGVIISAFGGYYKTHFVKVIRILE